MRVQIGRRRYEKAPAGSAGADTLQCKVGESIGSLFCKHRWIQYVFKVTILQQISNSCFDAFAGKFSYKQVRRYLIGTPQVLTVLSILFYDSCQKSISPDVDSIVSAIW